MLSRGQMKPKGFISIQQHLHESPWGSSAAGTGPAPSISNISYPLVPPGALLRWTVLRLKSAFNHSFRRGCLLNPKGFAANAEISAPAAVTR